MNNIIDYSGKNIEIYYSDRCIFAGKIINMKFSFKGKEIKLASPDNKFFFNLNHPNIKFNIVDNDVENKMDLDGIVIPKYADIIKYPNEIVYRENDITELDEEVKELVKSMNLIPGLMTTGSCCGHGTTKLWVNFICYDFNTLKKFVSIFEFRNDINFSKHWSVTTADDICLPDDSGIILQLKCKYKGKRAYKEAERLSNYLNFLYL